jgi:hypothetical protein
VLGHPSGCVDLLLMGPAPLFGHATALVVQPLGFDPAAVQLLLDGRELTEGCLGVATELAAKLVGTGSQACGLAVEVLTLGLP